MCGWDKIMFSRNRKKPCLVDTWWLNTHVWKQMGPQDDAEVARTCPSESLSPSQAGCSQLPVLCWAFSAEHWLLKRCCDDFRISVTQELPRWLLLSPCVVALQPNDSHWGFRNGSFSAITSGGVRHVYSSLFVSSQVTIQGEYQREGRRWDVGRNRRTEGNLFIRKCNIQSPILMHVKSSSNILNADENHFNKNGEVRYIPRKSIFFVGKAGGG